MTDGKDDFGGESLYENIYSARDVAEFVVKEIRIAYDKGSNDMLDRVIEQWEEVINSNRTDIQVIREFGKRLEAMRSQEDN